MKKALQSLIKFVNRWYRHLLALPVFFLLFLISKLVYSAFHDPISDSDYKQLLFSDYKLFGVTIPKDLNFCGEKVPIEDYHVKQALEKEFFVKTFFQPETMILNKKAGRWFPLIEPILKKNGVPDDFKYVAILESGLSNGVDNPMSGGFWGIMPPVAVDYGLEVSDQIDERFNVEKATDAACRIFKDAYKKYNSWTLAAAAYDLGMGGLDKQLAKQNTKNYYDLDLNDETAMYIYRLLAFKEMISRPEAYGYKINKRDLFAPIPTVSVKIDSTINDLSAFATSQGSTYEALKFMNPWLLKSSLQNPDRKTYVILFPKPGVKLYGMEIIKTTDSIAVPIPDSTIKIPVAPKTVDSIPH